MTTASRKDVEARVAVTQSAVMTARSDLTKARNAYVEAERVYIDEGKRAQLEKKRDAADEVERREALERRAVDAHEAARVELARLDREDKLVELGRLKDQDTYSKTLAEMAGDFVQADREIDARVMAIATIVHQAAEAFDRAQALADELRVSGPPGKRPNLSDICLTIRRAVTAGRQREGRDPLAPAWLATAPDAGDWRLRGTTAEELSGLQQGAASARAFAQRSVAQSIFAAGAAAAAKPRAAETSTTTEEPTT